MARATVVIPSPTMDAQQARSGVAGTPVALGDVLAGAYLVDAILGEGVTGVVVSATHLPSSRKVAIKILRTALASQEIRLRFEREARALARIASDHVVLILEVRELSDGGTFMVMEHLDGRDLARVLREDGPMPASEAVDCMLQVCDALEAAHEASIVHRDLKPANLFMTRLDDGTPHMKVVDFGISKILHREAPPKAYPDDDDDEEERARADDMTGVGSVLGSPRYMAPEQLKSSRNVDGRADLWSVGCVLYQLLSGRHPFAAPSANESLVRIMYDPPDPLGTAGGIPAALEGVVLKALAREADERFQTARDLAEALRPFASPRSARSGTGPASSRRPEPSG